MNPPNLDGAIIFGFEGDSPAIRLAKRAVNEWRGGPKSTGGARSDVVAVIAEVEKLEEAHRTAEAFVGAARARLNWQSDRKRRRREEKTALASLVGAGCRAPEYPLPNHLAEGVVVPEPLMQAVMSAKGMGFDDVEIRNMVDELLVALALYKPPNGQLSGSKDSDK